MKLYEQMKTVVTDLVSKNRVGYVISAQELKHHLVTRFGTNESSVIPPDYCYNRVNKGIKFAKHTRFLEYVEPGIYRCLGVNYPFNGPVYAQPKGTNEEIIVGNWENGEFTSNANWDLYCLK